MSMQSFLAPFVTLASPSGDHEEFTGDGHQLSRQGVLHVDQSRREFAIVDQSNPVEVLLQFHMRAIEDIEFQVIISGHGNFEAGRVRIIGVFKEEDGLQRLTMKMPKPDYKCLAVLIETMIGIRD